MQQDKRGGRAQGADAAARSIDSASQFNAPGIGSGIDQDFTKRIQSIMQWSATAANASQTIANFRSILPASETPDIEMSAMHDLPLSDLIPDPNSYSHQQLQGGLGSGTSSFFPSDSGMQPSQYRMAQHLQVGPSTVGLPFNAAPTSATNNEAAEPSMVFNGRANAEKEGGAAAGRRLWTPDEVLAALHEYLPIREKAEKSSFPDKQALYQNMYSKIQKSWTDAGAGEWFWPRKYAAALCNLLVLVTSDGVLDAEIKTLGKARDMVKEYRDAKGKANTSGEGAVPECQLEWYKVIDAALGSKPLTTPPVLAGCGKPGASTKAPSKTYRACSSGKPQPSSSARSASRASKSRTTLDLEDEDEDGYMRPNYTTDPDDPVSDVHALVST
jgi:hypothetical protein